MRNISIEDYRQFLSYCIDNPDSYVGRLKSVLSKEQIEMPELNQNISYYIYKYKHFKIEGINKNVQYGYLCALKKLNELVNPEPKLITFTVNTNCDLDYESFSKIKERIESLNEKYRLDFDGKEIIEIKSIEKGSIKIAILFLSVFAVYSNKVIKFIKEIREQKRRGELTFKKVNKAIIHSSLLFLEIAEVLMTLGDVKISIENQLTVIVVEGLLELLIDFID